LLRKVNCRPQSLPKLKFLLDIIVCCPWKWQRCEHHCRPLLSIRNLGPHPWGSFSASSYSDTKITVMAFIVEFLGKFHCLPGMPYVDYLCANKASVTTSSNDAWGQNGSSNQDPLHLLHLSRVLEGSQLCSWSPSQGALSNGKTLIVQEAQTKFIPGRYGQVFSTIYGSTQGKVCLAQELPHWPECTLPCKMEIKWLVDLPMAAESAKASSHVWLSLRSHLVILTS
jgi:hypothetical protein